MTPEQWQAVWAAGRDAAAAACGDVRDGLIPDRDDTCAENQCIAAILAIPVPPAPPEMQDWPETEDGVAEIVLTYRAFISERPALLSLLYDIDMLPEQTVSRAGAIRLAALCDVWGKGESGELSRPEMQRGLTGDMGALAAAKHCDTCTCATPLALADAAALHDAVTGHVTSSGERRAPASPRPCDACGRGILVDTVVDAAAWAKISPTGDEGGHLCASPRQEDILGYVIWQALDVDREDAASMADQLRDTGVQYVPPGSIVIPGPESGEAWEAMKRRLHGAIARAGYLSVPDRALDAAIRAALSPSLPDAKEGGDAG